MKLLLNVLKTLSILGLHAEKEKKKNSERYLKILVNLQSEEKAKLKQRSIGQMNPYFFNTEFVSSFFQ